MNLRDRVIELVRGWDDDELWAFLQPLLLDGEMPSPKAAAAAGKRGPGRPKKVIDKDDDDGSEPAPKKRGRPKKEAAASAGSNGASDLHKAVLKIVKKGGCSVSDVASAVGAEKIKVAAMLKSLVESKEIAKAGERRFTRYGMDSKTAKAASLAARGKQ